MGAQASYVPTHLRGLVSHFVRSHNLGLVFQVAEALAVVDKDPWYEAEMHRIKGELLLRQPVPDAPQAEAYFQQALAVARRQQAKSWELRAAMSLSRLWQHQGKRAKACQVLAEVYDWFTEGFDTPDLQEARALLDALLLQTTP